MKHPREIPPCFRRLTAAFALAALSLALPLACTGGPFAHSASCSDAAPEPAGEPPAGTPIPGSRWLYQLQDADPAAIAATDFDILVIDYSRTGTEEGRYTDREMALLHGSGTTGSGPAEEAGGRTVLAYLSIGEAEDYRFYFNSHWVNPLSGTPSLDAPCWLGRANSAWPGNYKVRYWSAAWQAIVLNYLDRIIDDGFDGVYLDIIDAYAYWADSHNGEGLVLSEAEAARRMISLVCTIAWHARVERGKPGFFIVPQNASEILAFDGEGSRGFCGSPSGALRAQRALPAGIYLQTISGIGVEDLYYNETTLVSEEEVSFRLSWLESIRNAGKTVLVVDYVDDGSQTQGNRARIRDFRSRATAAGFLPYAARRDRALDQIVQQTP